MKTYKSIYRELSDSLISLIVVFASTAAILLTRGFVIHKICEWFLQPRVSFAVPSIWESIAIYILVCVFKIKIGTSKKYSEYSKEERIGHLFVGPSVILLSAFIIHKLA